MTGPGPDQPANPDDPSGRLDSYIARTQTPLDVLALLTLWLVVVPPGTFGSAETTAFVLRLGLSAVYAVDITIRTRLARRHLQYLRTHLLSLIVVAVPALRLVFTLRLLRSMFRRGNLVRFLAAAALLVLNGAVIVYLFERHATGSNIHTLGNAVWWSLVTVTTVGYGDFYPVTTPGRITAVFIMFTGILTLAVVTAQVASSFVDQAARRSASGPPTGADARDLALTEMAQRLARIEALLAQSTTDGGLGSDESQPRR